MNKKLLITTCAVMLLSLNSCGVMFGGSKYSGTINVNDHPNAEIYVDGNKLGNGQATSLFPRNRPLVVEVKQEGCESQTQTFDKSFRTGNFILSAISWGIIGKIPLLRVCAIIPIYVSNSTHNSTFIYRIPDIYIVV